MNKQIKLSEIPYIVFEYILIVFLVLQFNTIWSHLVETRDSFNLNVNVFVCLMAFLCTVSSKYFRSLKRLIKTMVFILLFFVFMLIYIHIRPLNYSDFLIFTIVLMFLIGYATICFQRKRTPTFLIRYTNIVAVIAVVSIVLWLFGSVVKLIPVSGTVNSYWSGKVTNHFFNLQFETQSTTIPGTSIQIIRNTSFFVEAPMFSFCLLLAFMIELFLNRKTRLYICILLGIAVITTFSTTGYIFLVLACGIKLFITYFPNKNSSPVAIAVSVGFAVLTIVISIFLLKDKLSTSSGNIRLDDFRAGYLAWKDHMIFGNGFDSTAVKKYMSGWRNYNTGLSNSFSRLFPDMGLYGGILYLSSFVLGLVRNIKTKNLNKFIFIILFMGMWLITIVPYKYLTILILFFFAQQTERNVLRIRKKRLTRG